MKATRRDLSLVFMNKFDQDPENFLERIVTGDETWLYLHDPESKQASMEWRFKGDRAPIKPKMVRSVGKVMVTVIFDVIRCYSFGLPGTRQNRDGSKI
jgi:hypothetical protein